MPYRKRQRSLTREEERVERAERKRRRTTWVTDASENDKRRTLGLALDRMGGKKYSWMNQATNSEASAAGAERAQRLSILGDQIAERLSASTKSEPENPSSAPLSRPTTNDGEAAATVDDLEAALEAELGAKADAELEAEFCRLNDEEREDEGPLLSTAADKDICGTTEDALEEELSAMFESDSTAESVGTKAEEEICDITEKDLEEEFSALFEAESTAERIDTEATEYICGATEQELEEFLAMSEVEFAKASNEEVDDDDSEVEILSSREASLSGQIPANNATMESPKTWPEEEDDDEDEVDEELFQLLDASLEFLINRNF
ncbi:hypothetical protein GGR52DRAFT_584256 [Hypoxylon sp. FL1284]|nr:hypothetical protein GGR52DRAFT_584256 [Hypoxylon sp. FL1284]